jgi:hypothetical protein
VCHLKREHSNKVFKGVAKKGKSSTGWFVSLKLHLLINNLGEIVSFDLTPGNVVDNNHNLLKKLLSFLERRCVGDKGYLTMLFSFFYENGLHLITKPGKNMKPQPAFYTTPIPAAVFRFPERAYISWQFYPHT